MTLLRAFLHIRHVTHKNRHALVRGDDHLLDVVNRVQLADGADVDALFTQRDVVAACVGITVLHSRGHLRQRDAVCQQLLWIGLRSGIASHRSTKRGDVDDARAPASVRDAPASPAWRSGHSTNMGLSS